MFVVLSRVGSFCALRLPGAVCHFPYASVNDYPCSQKRDGESIPHEMEIEETSSVLFHNKASFQINPFSSSACHVMTKFPLKEPPQRPFFSPGSHRCTSVRVFRGLLPMFSFA